MAQGEAMVLRLLRLPYVVALVALHLSSALLAAPLQLYLLVLQTTMGPQVLARSRVLHALLWLPRWVGCTLFPVFAVGLMAAALYATHAAIEHEGKLIAIISTVSLGISLLITQVKGLFFPAMKILPAVDMGEYAKATVAAQLDLIAFIETVLATVTVVRIPWLVHWALSKESFKKANPYLQYCWAQLLYAVLDYACLPFLLIVLVTLWRLPQLRKLWKSANGEINRRLTLVATGINVLIDIPHLALTVPIVITLWRAPSFLSRLAKASVEEWRGICLGESLEWAKDIPFVFMALLTSLALWGRSYYFWNRLCDALGQQATAPGTKSWRWCVWHQFLCAVLDVPAFLCLVVVIVTQWNARSLLASLKEMRTKKQLGTWLPHLSAIKHFLWLVLDLPFIGMAVVITLTLWRLPRLVKKLRKTGGVSLARRRAICGNQFVCLILDIPTLFAVGLILASWNAPAFRRDSAGQKNRAYHLSVGYHLGRTLLELPYLACMLLVGVTLWRSWLLFKQLRAANDIALKKQACVAQAACVLLDLPCLLCAATVLVTVWDWGDMLHALRRLGDKSRLEPHAVILRHTLRLVRDLPALICAVFVGVTLWRAPALRHQLRVLATQHAQLRRDEANQNRTWAWRQPRRQACYDQAQCVFLDPLALLVAAAVFVTRWHWHDLVDDLRRLNASYWMPSLDAHRAIFARAHLALLDAPFFLFLAGTVVTFWRLPVLIARLRKAKPSSQEGLASARKACVQQFACGILDIPCLVCNVLIRLLRWNAKQLDAGLRPMTGPNARGRNGLRYHAAVFKNFGVLLLDTPHLLAIACIALTLWRLPTLVRLLRGAPTDSATTGQQLAKKRSAVMQVLGCVLLDVPALLAYAAVRATVWHYPDMKQKLAGKELLGVHSVVFASLGKVALDLPYFAAMALVVVAFWRLPSLYRRLKAAKSLRDMRNASCEVLLCALLDAVAAVLGLFSLLGVWHARALIASLKTASGLELHKAIFRHALATLIDLPYILLTLVTGLFFWRIPSLWTQFGKCSCNGDKRSVAFVQFRLALLDVAAVVVGLITLVTIWNAYSLVVQLRDAYKRYKEATSGAHVYSLKQGAQCHAVVFYNFALLVVDVPFLLLLLPLIVCGWRGAEVLRLWRRTDDYWAQRREIAMQFLLLLFDLPAAVCLAVLLVSWRAFSTVRQLRALWTTAPADVVAPDTVAASTAAEPSTAEADNPADAVSGEVNAALNKRRRKRREKAATRATAAKTSSAAQQQPTSFHWVVFSEFGSLALDLPFVLVAPLMLWRLPFFLRRLFQDLDTAVKRRTQVVEQVGETLLDLPFVVPFAVCVLCPWRLPRVLSRISQPLMADSVKRGYILRSALAGLLEYIGAVLVLVMIATLWRIPSLVHIYRTMRARSAARTPGLALWVRSQVGWLFVAWLQDIPFIPLFVITLPFVWRSRVLIRHMRQAPTDKEARHAVLGHALMLPADFVAGLAAVVIALTLWRLPSLFSRLLRTRFTIEMGEMSHWHEVMLTELIFWAVDLLQLLQILTVVVLIVHVPSLFSRLWALAKRHNAATGFSSMLQRKGRAYWASLLEARRKKARPASSGASATGGVELPQEVLLRIFSYLTYDQLALGAGLVCSDWWCLAEDDSLWRALLFSDSRWPGLGPDSPQVAKNQRRCKTLKQLFRFKHLGWQNQQRVLLALSPGANDYKLGYRYVIHQEFFLALKHIPATIMLPVKLAGYVLTPVLDRAIALRLSVLPATICNLHLFSLPRGRRYKTFWFMELYLLVRLAQCVGLLLNDLLTLVVLPLCLVYVAATLGSPLWSPQRTAPHWLRLVIHALSGTSFVLVLAYQIALAIGPYAVWVGYLATHWADMSWLLVILGSIGWLLACPCAQLVCHLQNRLFRQWVPMYQPGVMWAWLYRKLRRATRASMRLTMQVFQVTAEHVAWACRLVLRQLRRALDALVLLVRRIASSVLNAVLKLWMVFQKALGGNNRLLVRMTRWCYANGNVGNLLLTVLVPLWMFWPLALPLVLGSTALYIPAVLLCTRLFFTGYKIVDRNWGDKTAQFQEHKLKVESVTMEIGPVEGHGIRVSLRATKPKGLELKDFRLHLEGKRFWGLLKKLVGSGLISTFKWTMHPLNIKPFMTPDTFPADSTRFDTVVSFGTEGKIHISQATIMSKLKELRDAGDCELDLRLEYGENSFGWTALGTLAVVSTRPSQMLALANTSGSFIIKSPPVASSSSSSSSSSSA